MRIAFMGSPDFAVPAFDAILDAGFEIVCVYTQPPKPKGRGYELQKTAIHELAEVYGIEVRTPKSFRKDAEAREAFHELKLDVAVVAAYGLILPKEILENPKHGCINIHGSLLPRWRGAAPIQRAIQAGDEKTGVTIMQMDEGLDTGDMISMGEFPIGEEDTAQDIHNTMSYLGARMIVSALQNLQDKGKLLLTKQPEEGVTYAHKLDKAEGKLDWTKTSHELDCQVRAFTPWPGCWFEHEGERLKVLAVEKTFGSGLPGVVLDDELKIACSEESIKITRLQRSGKKPMDAKEFVKGNPIPKGTTLT